MEWKTFRDRLTIILLIILFGVLIADSRGLIDITKWGYAAVGSWIALIINFYYRKKGPGE